METVYIVGIVAVAVVLLGVVWLLRDRITAGRFGASTDRKSVEAEFTAVPPDQPGSAPPAEPPSVDISGNWLIGANVIRVLRDSARVARNRLLGKSRIDVTQPTKKKSKKRNK